MIKPLKHANRMPVISSVIASFLALIGGSCCLLPILFFNFGMSSAWVANLATLKPLRPYMLGISLALLMGGAFLYWRKCSKQCGPCDRPTRGLYLLLIAAVLTAIAIVWPWIDLKILRAVR
jgi:mercuric ion transport protein